MIYEMGFPGAFLAICEAPLVNCLVVGMAKILANHQTDLLQQVLQRVIAVHIVVLCCPAVGRVNKQGGRSITVRFRGVYGDSADIFIAHQSSLIIR